MRIMTCSAALIGLLLAGPAAPAQETHSQMALALPAIRVSSGGISSLIQRADVQGTLHLGIRQKNALSELFSQSTPGRVTVSVRGDQNSTPDSLQEQVEQQVRAQLGGHDAQIKAILNEEQWRRLQELSLQWRGPLALADTSVAQRVELSRDTRVAIEPFATRYNATKSEVFASLSQKQEDVSPDGSRRAVMMRVNASELEKPLSPARKKLEKAKREAEDGILAALTPEETARWKAACGSPFTFRADIKGLRF